MCKGERIVPLLGCILILLLSGQPIAAEDQPGEARAEMTRADTSERNETDTNQAGGMFVASVQNEINELKALIQNQRIQIEKLQSTVEQQQRQLDKVMSRIETRSAAAAAPASDIQAVREKVDDVELLRGELEAVAEGTAQANQRLSKAEADTAATNKTLEAKSKQLGNFNFSGDIRVRYEPFFQEGAEDRHRERFRARLNITGKLSDEISGGISFATGSLDDPVSTNQTIAGFLNRKNFALDRAYITYKPNYAKFLKLDAGKFAFPWYRTPLTFDSDVNPEGFAETLSFDLRSSALQNITIVGFQLPFNELPASHDSFVLGGQIQTHYRISSKVRLSLYGAGININRADPIAVAVGNGSLRPSLSNSNTFRTNASGTVLGYANKFAYLDTILKVDLDTNPRFPTTLLFNFSNNVRGSRERSAYWAEATVGRNKEAGDVQLGYAFIRIEKDAVIGAWNESDIRSSTNVLNHKLYFGYMIRNNVTGQFTAWIGHLANPLDNVDLVPPGVRGACTGMDVSGCEDPYLKRFQFDVIYKF
ncbi:MAG: hypothetical protein H6Q07_2554 [Acidobacteria bacterium]|nr:hypothetical protein [Acidobacteriota bacterium]